MIRATQRKPFCQENLTLKASQFSKTVSSQLRLKSRKVDKLNFASNILNSVE